jgi:hypothetical protein
MSKILGSRDDWKNKAIQRGNELREYRKERKRHLARIADLQAQLKETRVSKKKRTDSNTAGAAN